MTDRATSFMLSGVLAVLAIPLVLQRIPPNPIYGFRAPKTRSSPAVWYRANVFLGWALIASAIGSSLLALFGVPSSVALIVPIAAAVIASLFYLARMEE
jgi:uncharacterized membrane protein